jgi:hypothetical protein
MPLPAYVLRSYGGGAVVAQLVQEIGPSDTAFTITPTTGWTEADGNPLGTVGPFTVVIDRFTASVEKILCSGINLVTGVVTVETSGGSGRGYDGTTPQAHVPGGSTSGVQTCWSSVEAAEANKLVYDALGQLAAAGDITYASAAQTLGVLTIGTSGSVFYSTGTVPAWLAPGTSGQVLTSTGTAVHWTTVSFNDTGWIDATSLLQANWNISAGGICQYRKINGIVFLQMDLFSGVGATNPALTLPAGYLPGHNWYQIIENPAAGTPDPGQAEVSTAGAVSLVDHAAALSGPFHVTISYPADA